MQRRTLATVFGSLALTLVIGACGTTEADSDTAGASSQTETAPAASDGGSGECADVQTSTDPVSLTDSFGRQVELEAPAERVAVLEWQQLEDVLALCVSPVAVADADGYSLWNSAAELPEGVQDVGGRGEPNLDALYASDPDLIIIEAYTADDEIISTLESRDVPVLATKGADATDPVDNMLATFDLIAEAVGRTERAADVREQFEERLAEGKEAVADVGQRDFVYLDGWIQGGNVALRPFGQGSLMGELGEALGMRNAWTGDVDDAYGLGQTDIEGMIAVGDATIFHTGTEDPENDVVAELQKNDIWRGLPAVAEGRAHAFPPGIWTFGGPLSAMQVIDAYVDILTR